MKRTLVAASFFALAFPALGTPDAYAPYDRIVLDACEVHSSKDTCSARLAAIREGLVLADAYPSVASLPIDDRIDARVIKSPEEAITHFYCLAAYLGFVRPKEFEPEAFAYSVRGFTYSRESVQRYSSWLKTRASRPCRDAMKALALEPLSISIVKAYGMALNPTALLDIGAGDEARIAAMDVFAHERLHALFSERRAKARVLRLWQALSEGEREQFKKEHPSYDFRNPETIAREYFSYRFESDPTLALRFLDSPKPASAWRSELDSLLCRFCLSGDEATLTRARDLAGLAPKEALARVEADGVHVRILASKRRTPSKFFTWGSIRVDEGKLDQITKLEGALGKTLCKGERAEAASGMTIVVAADSPFSTLIHEYLHVLQIRKDPRWCPVSKGLWTKPSPSPLEHRLVRDREWDVRLVLLDLIDSPQMTLEDRLVVVDGAWTESEARKEFDPRVPKIVAERDLRKRRDTLVNEYVEALKTK